MSMNREALIARKHAVQQELKQAQRRLNAARSMWDQQVEREADESSAQAIGESFESPLGLIWRWVLRGVRGPRAHQARIVQLQQRVDSLMAEEYRLRCAIDQSRH